VAGKNLRFLVMRNANNSQVFTAKAVAEVKKAVNTEYNSVFGAVKALVMCDALAGDGRKMLSSIAGAKFSTSKDFRNLLTTQVLDNTPLYALKEGKRLAVDRVTRVAEDGTRTKHYVLRTRWTASKILDCYKVAVGDKTAQDCTALLEE
jgi:methyl coenzyme M reductase beta subunit